MKLLDPLCGIISIIREWKSDSSNYTMKWKEQADEGQQTGARVLILLWVHLMNIK